MEMDWLQCWPLMALALKTFDRQSRYLQNFSFSDFEVFGANAVWTIRWLGRPEWHSSVPNWVHGEVIRHFASERKYFGLLRLAPGQEKATGH
jgi:hypothetical protein